MSVLDGHACAPSDNPRFRGTCRKCGRPIQDPSTRRRDLESEREITREAAKGVVDPDPLITFAETRAQSLSGEYVTDSMLVLTGRDRLRDALEEAADLRNHLVWWIQDHIGHEKAQDAFYALRHLTLLYDLLSEDVD